MPTNWKDWYFTRAKSPISPTRSHLLWREVRVSSSPRALKGIAESVLDMDNPYMVDWTNIRSGHLLLKMESVDKRTMLLAQSVLQRLVSKGIIPKANEWFRKLTGFSKRKTATPTLEILNEDQFLKLLESLDDLPGAVGWGLRAALPLRYYCGMTHGQVTNLRKSDIIYRNREILIYCSGRLINLPPHVRKPLEKYLVSGPKYRSEDPKIFTGTHSKTLAKYPNLHNTYQSLRKMRG